MEKILYLTKAEQAAFEKLAEGLRTGWTVTNETDEHQETDYQLWIRTNMLDLEAFPQLKELVAAAREGKPANPASIKEIPPAVLPEVLFALGARGISQLIGALMERIESLEDIEFLASLALIRHDIIAANAAIPA